jgi:hypothetical protein
MPLKNNTLTFFKHGNIFIETGTLYGDGIKKALDAGFGRVISIDIDPAIVEAAKKQFANAHQRVEIILGDSKKALAETISTINEPCTFWLDAHWDMGPVCGEVICPLYDELTAIKNHPIKNHRILIDDMRIIGNPHHHWGKTVQKDAIIAMLKQINPNYSIAYTPGDLGSDGGGEIASDIMVALA